MFKFIAQLSQEDSKALNPEYLDSAFEKAEFLEESKEDSASFLALSKVLSFQEYHVQNSLFLRELNFIQGH
jgi:hypothetical protein